uniref:Alpha-carbonic anhydrase domain-containing protein n=1 Tax=Steinernema glaseri TaxID=37863 RepID=A0A1I7YH83_9BILA
MGFFFKMKPLLLAILAGIVLYTGAVSEYPWTFDNDLLGGPDFWGLLNKHWRMCTMGQMQSPVNIDPSKLFYDAGLSPIAIDNNVVEAELHNTGQLPVLTINDSLILSKNINISGGPGSPYKYRLHKVIIHFGRTIDGEKGSEHTVDFVRFPAEVQLIAYNTDLYTNFTEAMTQPRGLLAIAVIVDIRDVTNTELRKLTVASQSVTYKDSKTILKKFNVHGLLPKTTNYVTYEGSLTFPGCYETVTWVIMNNPIYITKEDLQIWNDLQQTEFKQPNPVFMFPNYRPLKTLNGRLLRTNIKVKYKRMAAHSCSSNVYLDMGYQANPTRSHHKRHASDENEPNAAFSVEKLDTRADILNNMESFDYL